MQKPSVITESGGQRHREPKTKIATLMPAAGPARPSIAPRRYVKYVDDLWLSPPPPPEPEGVRIRIRGRHTTDTSRRAAATGWLRARGNGAGGCGTLELGPGGSNRWAGRAHRPARATDVHRIPNCAPVDTRPAHNSQAASDGSKDAVVGVACNNTAPSAAR